MLLSFLDLAANVGRFAFNTLMLKPRFMLQQLSHGAKIAELYLGIKLLKVSHDKIL